MTARPLLKFLYPRTHRDLSFATKDAYMLFYSTGRNLTGLSRSPSRASGWSTCTYSTKAGAPTEESKGTSIGKRSDDFQQRLKELQNANALKYPRIQPDRNAISCAEFKKRYAVLNPEESRESDNVTLRGRLYSSRIAGTKLAFLDVVQDGNRVQGLVNLRRLQNEDDVQAEQFKEFYHLARRGDIVEITGVPTRTKRGELSINATKLPAILTPALASLPNTLDDPETRIRNRHADILVNQKVADTLKLRSHIVQYLRNFLITDDFLEVQTPIIAEDAGGAIARPFNTVATEFSTKTLSLRIAPEIWLKRLILGGIERVFELGRNFRNEGADATHNPEFTTCEFYKSFADLEELIKMTEDLFSGLASHVNELISSKLTSLDPLDTNLFTAPFQRIEFIPDLEQRIGRKLPDLEAENAAEAIASLFSELSQPLPSSPTLPRMLDKLASIYLEPSCDAPTFIIHHPACMAPLAKSFRDPATNQLVSARVELFVQHKELANMYEEENSPFEQRRKFVQQVQWKDEENEAVIDESYLEALEWGLPPTGGWGCGIDRLCMLMSGATRISDVLAFGSLKNVVGLGKDSYKS
ncbi:lysyl-tRNA synthetase [Pseudogymnoascus sp. 24MN13]|nr:lysyl-tRNA synthetase [Pseudogymnoascus sp. 24MN13]